VKQAAIEVSMFATLSMNDYTQLGSSIGYTHIPVSCESVESMCLLVL